MHGVSEYLQSHSTGGAEHEGGITMAIKLAGEFEVRRTPEEVYEFLVDPGKFAPLLPEFRGMAVQDANHFTVKVSVGISHIKGVADVRMELAQDERPKRAQYKGQGSVAGGSV